MRIKTFEAPTMQEALTQARNELGEDAVVLNTRHVKGGGILGIGGGNKVELMAAIDDNHEQQVVEPPKPAVNGPVSEAVPAMAALAGKLYGSGAATATMPAPAPAPAPAAAFVSPAVATAPAPPVFAVPTMPKTDVDPEVMQLRMELRQLTSVVQGLLGNGSPASTVCDKPLLVRLGVDEDLARGVLSDLLCIDDPASLTAALAGKTQAFAAPPVLDTRQVIAVVGPTGVGKTTTLAKLAAKFSLEQGKKVALVTADTYRIGAVEQLRTYARIMGIPIEIALSPEEVAAGVAKHQDKDVVLIDTVGRSQRNADHLAELKTFLDAAGPVETHLVVAASLSSEIQKEVVDKFSIFSPSRLIITKLDEAPNRGCLVNLPLGTGIGVSCVTYGQNVPQDIDLADAGSIARLLTEVA